MTTEETMRSSTGQRLLCCILEIMFSRLVSGRIFASLVTLLIIGGSVACYFTYNATLDTSISETRERQVKSGQVEWKRQAVLDDYGRDNEILHGPTLALLYLGDHVLSPRFR